MPTFRRQVPIRLGRRTIYLDMLAERERVNIELDGATTHGDPRQREIDLRRDALLATVGILVVRFAHRRLVHEADEVRRETLRMTTDHRPGSHSHPIDREDGLVRLAEADARRTIVWENLLLLGDEPTVAAAAV
jgi:very-short-patch-repair endonuclease